MTKQDATSNSIGRFAKACQELRKELQENIVMNETEQLQVENSVALVQMGYIEWKRRNLSAKQAGSRKPGGAEVLDG